MKARTAVLPIAKAARTLDRIPPRWQFAVFLGGTLLVGLALTALAYELYVVSGTAQLDLSRPGYKQALKEVGPGDGDSDYHYAASGPLTKQALDEFAQKYTELTAKTKGYSAFDPAALSDEQLGLGDSTVVGPQ